MPMRRRCDCHCREHGIMRKHASVIPMQSALCSVHTLLQRLHAYWLHASLQGVTARPTPSAACHGALASLDGRQDDQETTTLSKSYSLHKHLGVPQVSWLTGLRRLLHCTELQCRRGDMTCIAPDQSIAHEAYVSGGHARLEYFSPQMDQVDTAGSGPSVVQYMVVLEACPPLVTLVPACQNELATGPRHNACPHQYSTAPHARACARAHAHAHACMHLASSFLAACTDV
jgi:hypothetical protein